MAKLDDTAHTRRNKTQQPEPQPEPESSVAREGQAVVSTAELLRSDAASRSEIRAAVQEFLFVPDAQEHLAE